MYDNHFIGTTCKVIVQHLNSEPLRIGNELVSNLAAKWLNTHGKGSPTHKLARAGHVHTMRAVMSPPRAWWVLSLSGCKTLINSWSAQANLWPLRAFTMHWAPHPLQGLDHAIAHPQPKLVLPICTATCKLASIRKSNCLVWGELINLLARGLTTLPPRSCLPLPDVYHSSSTSLQHARLLFTLNEGAMNIIKMRH